MLTQNFSIIEQRWPELSHLLMDVDLPAQVELLTDSPEQTLVVDGIQISSRFDRMREARLQASLVPESSKVVTLYGLAMGDLIRIILARPELRQLNLVLMHRAADRANFGLVDHRDWLNDPRVNILNSETERELRIPFSCSPASLYLTDDHSARLRDLIYLELSTPYIRKQHSSREAEVLLQLDENEPYILRDYDVAELSDEAAVTTTVIAAAGPTLTDQLGWMKAQRDRFRLIAVDAAVRALLDVGITPDYVLSVDSSPALFDLFFEGLDIAALTNTRLVYFPLVNRKILEAWPGKRYVAYSRQPIFFALAEKYPRGTLFSSGSVIHPAVDLAIKMGTQKIIFTGADFSFTKDQSHVSGSHLQLDMKNNVNCWVLNSRGERVPSSQNYVGYLRDLERFLAWHKNVSFLNASHDGASIDGTSLFAEETYRWV